MILLERVEEGHHLDNDSKYIAQTELEKESLMLPGSSCKPFINIFKMLDSLKKVRSNTIYLERCSFHTSPRALARGPRY